MYVELKYSLTKRLKFKYFNVEIYCYYYLSKGNL